MSEIKPVSSNEHVSIKTAEERYEQLCSPVLPDIAFRDCLKSEAKELRAALEALQETNAAQEKRINEIREVMDQSNALDKYEIIERVLDALSAQKGTE